MPRWPSEAALAHDGVRLTIGPLTVRLRSDLPGVAEYVDRLYQDFPRTSSPGEHFDIAIVGTPGWRRMLRPQANFVGNGRRPFLPVPAAVSGGMFEWGMNWCIGTYAHRWLAIHSAVIATDAGAILLSAQSGAGKSTLCAAMVVAGWRLFSDEFGLLDVATGELLPLPRPVALKNRAIDIIRRRAPGVEYGPQGIDVERDTFVHMRPPVESVRRAAERAVPRFLIVPRYRAGAPTSIEPLTKAEALVHIGDQSFNYNYLGARGFEALADMVDRCRCYRIEYSDLDDLLPRLRALTA